MPILDLQRRLAESGRIRFGNKKGNRPNRLDHPLLTSPDRELIEKVAAAYGGKVEPWPGGEGQWQTEVDSLRILVPVSPEPLSSWWERWSGGGCMRRCDGFHDTINDAPCDCDKEAEKRACSATTRIAVLLPETGDARWRIETKSMNAAMELPDALVPATGEATGEVVPGVLTVEQRRGKKGSVPVPVITLGKSGAAAAGTTALEAGASTPPVEQSPEPEGTAAPSRSGDLINEAQRRRLFAIAKEHSVETAEVKRLILGVTGQDSTKGIPTRLYESVVDAVTVTGRGSTPTSEGVPLAEVEDALFAPERRKDVP